MPVNKEALIRYRAINQELIRRAIATQQDLIEACTDAVGVEIAWRTIAGDIRAMRTNELLGYNAPIENVRGEGYRYTDKNYSIDQIPLQHEEVTALSFAAKLLKQYSHVQIFSTFSGAVEKLSQNLDVQLRNKDQADMGSLLSFEQSTTDGGSIYLNDFLNHIRRNTVVSILYTSFSSGTTKEHILHPYFLKEYRNRWYVLGFHESYNELRTLALERIQDLKPNYSLDYRIADFDVAEYYKNSIGVSVTTNIPVDVVLEVLDFQWQYLQSQPLHHSQKLLSSNNGSVLISLTLIPNYELKSLILSMGSAVTVVGPKSLRKEIINEVSLINNRYNNS